MDELEGYILEAAKEHKDDFKSFSNVLTSNINVSIDEFPSFFIYVGSFLSKMLIYDLALSCYSFAMENSDNIEELISCYGGIGVVYNNMNNRKNAKEFLIKGFKIAQQNKIEIKEAWYYLNLGIAYYDLKEYSNAIRFYNMAQACCEADNNLSGIGICFGNIGSVYKSLKEYDKALDYQTKSLQISIRLNDIAGEALCNTNIGNILYDKHEYQDAITYYAKSLQLYTRINNTEGQAESNRNIGIMHRNMLNYNEAEDLLLKALALYNGSLQGKALCTMELGNIYYLIGDHNKAIEYFNKALDTNLRLGQAEGIADCYSFLGIVYNNLYQYDISLDYSNKALQCFIELDNKENQCKCYENIGLIYDAMGDFITAVKYHEKVLEISKLIDYHQDDSSIYANIGAAYRNIGNYIKALEYCEMALAIDKKTCDKLGEAASLTNLGNTYLAMGNYTKANECHYKSLEIDNSDQNKQCFYNNIGNVYLEQGNYMDAKEIFEKAIEYGRFNKHLLLKSNINMGKVYEGLGFFDKAIGFIDKALEINNVVGDSSEKIKCYIELWNIYIKTNQYWLAEKNLEKARVLIEKSGNKLSETIYYQCLSQQYIDQGDFDNALSVAKQAMDFVKNLSSPLNTAPFYNTIGSIYQKMGMYGISVEYHERALNIISGSGNLLAEATCCTNIGLDYFYLMKYEKALEYQEKALDLSIKMGSKLGEAACSSSIGLIYDNMKCYEESIHYFEMSLDISSKTGLLKGTAINYLNIANAYQGIGKVEKAIEYAEKALGLYNKYGNEIDIGKCYHNLGLYNEMIGNKQEALTNYQKAHEIAKKYRDIDFKRVVKLILSKFYSDHFSDYEKAYDLCKESIEISESISGRVVEETNRISISNNMMLAYHYMIQLCICTGRDKEALEYLERSKSRAFIGLLAATDIKNTVSATPEIEALLKEEKKHLNKLRAIQIRHVSPDLLVINTENTEDILKSLDGIYNKLELLDPQYVSIRRSKPVSFDRILELLCLKQGETTLIEYFIAKDCLYIFIVSSRDRKLHVKRIDITEAKLNRYVFEDYMKSIAKKDFGDIGESWLALGQYLIAPISDYLHEGDTVCFVPYGCLHYLPLHALKKNDLRIIEQHPVVFLQSASLMELYFNKASNRYESVASLGIDFEDEAKEIASIFGVAPYLNNEATKERFLTTCLRKDIIHFSCHGYFDADDPLSSGIKLYDDLLTARETYNIRLEAKLTVLSACETGFNQRAPGDEMIGLARAFLYAGTPSIVVSLWRVNSKSTEDLMISFYNNLKAGMNKARALQHAQLKVMHENSFEHPHYWAPFILIGNWD